jgi:hypothetical protein
MSVIVSSLSRTQLSNCPLGLLPIVGRRRSQIVGAVPGGAAMAAMDLEALLMGAIAVLTFGLGLFAVVAAIPVTFWLGLLVVGAFGWATFPRAKVR